MVPASAAGQLGDHARERVGREGGLRVRVARCRRPTSAASAECGCVRDVAGQVALVQPVDRQQQHVLRG